MAFEPTLPISTVQPSGRACATPDAPIVPPPPALFSTTTDVPARRARWFATRRPTRSVVPPGAAGTTMRIDAPGQAGMAAGWAMAAVQAIAAMAMPVVMLHDVVIRVSFSW